MRFSAKWIVIFALAIAVAISAASKVLPRASVSELPVLDAASRTAEEKAMPPLTPSSFGFQCGTGLATNCPNATWPNTIAQPGLIRLWDSQVQWHALNPGPDVYNWRTLDAYLDVIAAHQPRDVMYTFGYTPCWDTKGQCERAWGSISPPSDLSETGSLSFNKFVTALTGHCSPAGHCVKDYIKYWELWNEANAPHFWAGTIPQLYGLMSPAVGIVRKQVPGALILTPPANRGDTDWMQGWLNEENKRGRLSDIYAFHLYLLSHMPEMRFALIQDMIKLKDNTSGWRDTPWMNTETNFDLNFACNSRFSPDDCMGQLVRWHLLHYSYGARNVSWFFFNTTIGRNPDYSNAYHSMMQWLVGGHFTAECSAKSTVVTCPFIEGNGHHAMFVWNFRTDMLYDPPAEYVTYKTLGGSTATVTRGRPVTIGAKPIMLETAN